MDHCLWMQQLAEFMKLKKKTKNGKTEAPPHTIVNKITTEIERTKRTIYRTNIENYFKSKN